MIGIVIRLIRNLIVNSLLAIRNLVRHFRKPPQWVRVEIRGAIGERPAPRHFWSKRSTSIAGLRELFEEIAANPTVRGVILRIRDLQVGRARLDSLRDAIALLTEAEKQVVAHLRAPGNPEYYVGCAAQRIVLDPASSLGLVGLKAEVTFLGDLLERVGVRAELHAIGAYKTAADNLRRNAMSPEHRESLERILDVTFDRLVAAIAAGRRMTPEQVRALIDDGPFAAERALQAGLCDAVLYADELPEYLALPGAKRVSVRSLRNYRASVVRWSWLPLLPRRTVAIVPVRGMIVDGEGGDMPIHLCGGDSMSRTLRELRENSRVAAVVLQIESPGGSALASDQIWRETLLTARKKPVVAWFGDVAASGGYYIGVGAQVIVAQPETITGSIGVVGGKFSLERLFGKLGIRREILKRGAYADWLDDAHDFSEPERARLQVELQTSYDEFVWRVATNRLMTFELCHQLAQGRIYTGSQAHSEALVDQLGGLSVATDVAIERARRKDSEKFRLRDIVVKSQRAPTIARLLGAFGRAQTLAWWPFAVRISLWALTLGVAAVPVACAATSRPDRALYAYADALERGDGELAYSMLGPELRRQYTREEFVSSFRVDPESNRRLARALRDAAGKMRERASVPYKDGLALHLVREGEAWRIDGDPLDFYPQATPAQALRSFVHALERRRYDVVQRLAPSQWRKAMTVADLQRDFDGPRRQEIETLCRRLRAHFNDPIQEDGNQAVLRYDDTEVRFVREDDGWKIQDPD